MADRRPVPWWEPCAAGGEVARLADVIESNYFNEGEITTEFEARIAELVGARHAVATTSGTSALFLALSAAGIRPGEEVLVPNATFVATANAVLLAGAKPVLVDIDERTLTIDVAHAENRITGRTRAIIPVHVSGRGADMEAIGRLAGAHGLVVIEDAAEALCSVYRGRPLGTWGAAGCFSFSPNKTITTGQGGMVVTDDPALARRLRELKDQGRAIRGTGGDDAHPTVGYNFKLTNLQAAVGLAQLEQLQARLDRQRAIYQRYTSRLGAQPGIRLLPFDIEGGERPLWTDAVVEHRDALVAELAAAGIGCRRFWHPLHTQAPFAASATNFPVSSRHLPQALWLPSAYTLSDAEVDRVCDVVSSFLSVK